MFRDHQDALANLPGGHNDPNANMESKGILPIVATLAQKAGYDSIQYTHRLEYIYHYEIQDVRDFLQLKVGTCPGPSKLTFAATILLFLTQHALRLFCNAEMSRFIRGGYNASEPCKCTGQHNIMGCAQQNLNHSRRHV